MRPSIDHKIFIHSQRGSVLVSLDKGQGSWKAAGRLRTLLRNPNLNPRLHGCRPVSPGGSPGPGDAGSGRTAGGFGRLEHRRLVVEAGLQARMPGPVLYPLVVMPGLARWRHCMAAALPPVPGHNNEDGKYFSGTLETISTGTDARGDEARAEPARYELCRGVPGGAWRNERRIAPCAT